MVEVGLDGLDTRVDNMYFSMREHAWPNESVDIHLPTTLDSDPTSG